MHTCLTDDLLLDGKPDDFPAWAGELARDIAEEHSYGTELTIIVTDAPRRPGQRRPHAAHQIEKPRNRSSGAYW